MMLLLARRKPCSIVLPFFARFCSASAPQNPDPKLSNFSLSDYLVASWGFSPVKAASFSKRLTHLKSPEKPDAVLRFLNHRGFSQAEIQKLVTWNPTIFTSSLETTLEPNLNALRKMGLSSSALDNIILTSPGALQIHSAVPRINFWLDFFGGNEEDLVMAFKQNKSLVNLHISKNILPKISFLQSHGFSTRDIKRMVRRIPRFMNNSVASIEKKLERAKELGFHPESGMFVSGLHLVSALSREKLQEKMQILESFGVLENDFFSMLKKSPTVINRSMESLREKMTFLLGETRCDLSYIVSHPALLQYSLEKRVRPRQHVLHLLDSKGLSTKQKGHGLLAVMNATNSTFVKNYILPHKNEIPELHDVYPAACASRS